MTRTLAGVLFLTRSPQTCWTKIRYEIRSKHSYAIMCRIKTNSQKKKHAEEPERKFGKDPYIEEFLFKNLPEEWREALEKAIEVYNEIILPKYGYQLHDDHRWISTITSELGELCQKTRDSKSAQEYTTVLQDEGIGIIATMFAWMHAVELRTATDTKRNYNATMDAEHALTYNPSDNNDLQCPKCGSREVTKLDPDEWACETCGRVFNPSKNKRRKFKFSEEGSNADAHEPTCELIMANRDCTCNGVKAHKQKRKKKK